MAHHQCLNCDAALNGKYCADCGQKADTHRLSMKHFIAHDLVHGIWHLDKGIIYTIRRAIVKPGTTAKEYIAGKRVGHYNLITLLLLLFAVLFYLQHKLDTNQLLLEIKDKNGVAKTYPYGTGIKAIIFSFVPIFALAAQLIFRKAKYNYTEHIVAAAFTLVGVLIIVLIISILDWTITDYFFTNYFIEWLFYALFISFAYFQLVNGHYSGMGFAWRVVAMMAGFAVMWLLLAVTLVVVFGLTGFNIRYN